MESNSNSKDARQNEISGSEFVERQTRRIMEEFKTSRPRPRNRQMGFEDESSTKRRQHRRRERLNWL